MFVRSFAALALIAAPALAQEAPRAVTAAEMRAEARVLAAGDAVLLAEIEDLEAAANRGVLGSGPTSVRQAVPGGRSWSLPLVRRAEEPLTIAVRRIGPGQVTLAVVDEGGRQLCADAGDDAVLTCRVAPGAGKLVARVANPGATATDILLLAN
ncbi:hypothetical protein [Sphingomonas sp.]|uniref:hypothetical protein n=1 Tax=Sphingomonas sp. TaxID=28214 RepID=UPI001EB3BAEF|nr:hypothetical protein [Sphingomonas sp.]MBX3593706.1 hypothetical protein [Sphingomonas sp.]